MSRAQVIHELGAPDAMIWQPWEVPEPGAGEVLLRHTAIEVNYADLYHRSGTPHPWPVPPCPTVVGFEATGVVEALGADVDGFAVGDRVAYGLPPLGSYAEYRTYPADTLIALPDGIDDQQVAGAFMRGMTAHYLLHRTYPVQPGDTVLVHAAAGGMGLILGPWARALGARVVGTVSTPAKADLAREAGYHRVVVRPQEDFVAAVREESDGRGAAVVYEAIGRDTLQRSLDSLRPLGVCAAYGHASGPPDPVDLVTDLGARGSLFLTRPAIMHYLADRADLETAAGGVFAAVADGIITATPRNEFRLADAPAAHRALESGATTGPTVLLP